MLVRQPPGWRCCSCSTATLPHPTGILCRRRRGGCVVCHFNHFGQQKLLSAMWQPVVALSCCTPASATCIARVPHPPPHACGGRGRVHCSALLLQLRTVVPTNHPDVRPSWMMCRGSWLPGEHGLALTPHRRSFHVRRKNIHSLPCHCPPATPVGTRQ